MGDESIPLDDRADDEQWIVKIHLPLGVEVIASVAEAVKHTYPVAVFCVEADSLVVYPKSGQSQ